MAHSASLAANCCELYASITQLGHGASRKARQLGQIVGAPGGRENITTPGCDISVLQILIFHFRNITRATSTCFKQPLGISTSRSITVSPICILAVLQEYCCLASNSTQQWQRTGMGTWRRPSESVDDVSNPIKHGWRRPLLPHTEYSRSVLQHAASFLGMQESSLSVHSRTLETFGHCSFCATLIALTSGQAKTMSG